MKIVFLSNFFNHHQKALSDALGRTNEYYFAETEKMDAERKKLGWNTYDGCSYLVNEDSCDLPQLIGGADLVITGVGAKLTLDRIRRGGLTFKYSERPLKKGCGAAGFLPRYVKWHLDNPQVDNFYLLCASAYTAADYAKFGLFRGKAYKWGYFPELRKYANVDDLISKKDTRLIIWCGRFLDWKHPDAALRTARRLRDEKIDFKMLIIGTGQMQRELEDFAKSQGLSDFVCFAGSMPPEQVRNNMEKAGIALFTSDFQEGWGAVLNEFMNSGCAVVASHAAGSVPYLVKDGENGYIYRSGNEDRLYERLAFLLENPQEQRRLGQAAYKTVAECWNADVAAARLTELAGRLLDGERSPDIYSDGPCSRSEILENDWYKQE